MLSLCCYNKSAAAVREKNLTLCESFLSPWPAENWMLNQGKDAKSLQKKTQ